MKIKDFNNLLEKRISIGRTIGPTPQAVTVGELFETVKNVKGVVYVLRSLWRKENSMVE